VIGFLAVLDKWKSLSRALDSMRKFIDANRNYEFDASCRLADLIETHPLPEDHPKAVQLLQAMKDMAAIVSVKEVIGRWPDYQEAFERAFKIYRDVYNEVYRRARVEADATLANIKASAAYLAAPPEKRDSVVNRVFGDGKVCHYPEIKLSSIAALLEAGAKRSLASLAQAMVALPGYYAQIEAELSEISSPPAPGEKLYEWRPTKLQGKRLKTEKEVDEALAGMGDELKTRIRDGYTVVVKLGP
jgi:hypothetical protein